MIAYIRTNIYFLGLWIMKKVSHKQTTYATEIMLILHDKIL